MYAIIKALGKQFRAEKDATLQLPYMEEKQPGDVLTFDEVLLLGEEGNVRVGKPTVAGAKVTAEVLGMAKGQKVVAFRFKRRKNVRVKRGHRQKFTRVRITGIEA